MFLLLYKIVFIVCVHTAAARIYLFNNQQLINEIRAENDHDFDLNMSPTTAGPSDVFFGELQPLYPNDMLAVTQIDVNNCDRNSGNIFDMEIQKILCLENMAKVQGDAGREKIPVKFDRKRTIGKQKNPTKISGDYIDLSDLYRKGSDDLIDESNSKRALPTNLFDYIFVQNLGHSEPSAINNKIITSILSKCGDSSMRKFNTNKKYRKRKSKKVKKIKRFEIVDGDGYHSQEVRKPISNLKEGNDVYLQGGNRVVTLDNEDNADGRRRLPQFLPKRYHWQPSEIHDLGYYWFNGPKGQYPDPTPLKR